MSVSRYSLLLEPNRSILPSNLKFNILKEKVKIKKNKNKFNFDGSLMNDKILPCKTEEKKESEILDIKEIQNLKKLLKSSQKKNKLKLYLIKNIYFLIKILGHSNKKQIEDMIKYPEIIIEPIKLYIKKNKFNNKYKDMQKDLITKLKDIPGFQTLLNNKKSLSKEKIDRNKSVEKIENHASNSSYSVDINNITKQPLFSEN